MSKDTKQLKQEAEATIEMVLHGLRENGVNVFRIQVIPCRGESPQVNIVLDEKGGI